MGIFLDFIKLSYPEKILALESLFWVILIRVMIWVFPFSFVQKRVQIIANYLSPDELDKIPTVKMKRIRMMIVIISRYIPWATCLVQAMAGHILFSRYGYNTIIKIGVLNEDGVFEAHAWLEKNGDVVLGESEKNYKTILGIRRDSS